MGKTTYVPDFKEPMDTVYVKIENDEAFFTVKERFANKILEFIDRGHNKYDSVRKGFLEILAHGDAEDLNEIIKYKMFLTKYVAEDEDLLRRTDFFYDKYDTMVLFPQRQHNNGNKFTYFLELHKKHNIDSEPSSIIQRVETDN